MLRISRDALFQVAALSSPGVWQRRAMGYHSPHTRQQQPRDREGGGPSTRGPRRGGIVATKFKAPIMGGGIAPSVRRDALYDAMEKVAIVNMEERGIDTDPNRKFGEGWFTIPKDLKDLIKEAETEDRKFGEGWFKHSSEVERYGKTFMGLKALFERPREVRTHGPLWHAWMMFLVCLPSMLIVTVCETVKRGGGYERMKGQVPNGELLELVELKNQIRDEASAAKAQLANDARVLAAAVPVQTEKEANEQAMYELAQRQELEARERRD